MKLLLVTVLALLACQVNSQEEGDPLGPPEKCMLKIDVTFLVDSSASVATRGGYSEVKKFVKAIIENNMVTDEYARFAMITFSDTAQVTFGLDDCGEDVQCMFNFIDAASLQGANTNINAAFELVMDVIYRGPVAGDRPDGTDVVLLITDGEPNIDEQRLLRTTTIAKNRGIRIAAVAVGTDVSDDLMFDIISVPWYFNYFYAKDFTQLNEIVPRMKEMYCPPIGVTTPSPVYFDCNYDIAMLVDMSGSIIEFSPFDVNWKYLRRFLKDFTENTKNTYQQDVLLSLTTFRNYGNLKFNFADCNGNTNVSCMIEEIDKLRDPDGATNMVRAFTEVRDKVFGVRGDRSNVPDLIMYMTDGFPNPFDPQLFPLTRDIKDKDNIRIFGIGVTKKVNVSILYDIVSYPPEENFLLADDFVQLASKIDEIIQRTCVVPTTTPAPTTPVPYKRCSDPGDMVFVMDSSGSIGGNNFETIKQFVSEIIMGLPVENDQVRIGVEHFSTNYKLVFHLNKHSDRQSMADDVMTMKYAGGNTGTGYALRYARDSMLTTGNGDRPDRKNVVVVLTDGGSQNQRLTMEEATKLKQKAHVVAIQIGSWVNEAELHAIASYPYDTNVIKVSNFLALQNITDQLRNLICNNNKQCTDDYCENGGTCVDVNGKAICTCPDGFIGERCDSPCKDPADIIFTLDKSGSIGPQNFQKQLDFVKNVVSYMNFDMQRAGLVSFSDRSNLDADLGDLKTKTAFLNALDIYYARGSTNTAEALRTVRDTFRRRGTREVDGKEVTRIAVVLTDGRSNDESRTWQAAMDLRSMGVTVIVIGVGNSFRPLELESIASDPVGENVFHVDSFDDLKNIQKRLNVAMCKNNTCSRMPCKNGGTCVDVVNGRICKCPDGYSGPDCGDKCSSKKDLGLLLDASGSIRNYRFQKVVNFLTKVLGNLTIGPDDTRVGAVSWSDVGTTEFALDKYKTKENVIQAVRHIQFKGRRTYTASALQAMGSNVFTRAGDRRDVPNFVLMVTDGGSNISPRMTIPAARELKQKGTHITVLALGDDMNPRELKALASDPWQENLIEAETEDKLDSLITDVYKSTCNDIDECEADPCLNGGQCRDGLNFFRCDCASGFAGVTCGLQCPDRRDIVLILDVSGSVNHIYSIILEFAKKVIMSLPIHNDQFRVGVITFADRANNLITLNKYKTTADILNAMVFAREGERTYTNLALMNARRDLFSTSYGARPGVEKFAVVVTDGMSTSPSQTLEEANKLHADGHRIVGVAVGMDANMAELNAMASAPEGWHVISIPETGDVEKGVNDFMNIVCSNRPVVGPGGPVGPEGPMGPEGPGAPGRK